jgi:hypothetical protein
MNNTPILLVEWKYFLVIPARMSAKIVPGYPKGQQPKHQEYAPSVPRISSNTFTCKVSSIVLGNVFVQHIHLKVF